MKIFFSNFLIKLGFLYLRITKWEIVITKWEITIKKYHFWSSPTLKIISPTYPEHQNNESALSWKYLICRFSSDRSQGIKKDLKWHNLKSEDREIELPGRDSNLRPID